VGVSPIRGRADPYELPKTYLVMFGRTTVLIALALAFALPASAPARQAGSSKAPAGLKAFLLSYREPVKHEFSRTPSFAWAPVSRALSYDFELATDSSFRGDSIVWSSDSLPNPLTAPVVSVPLSLPWITGNPYGLYARARAVTQTGTTRWSSNFGFNMRWPKIPTPLSAPPGLIRWTPVDGATAYQVWERNIVGSGGTVPANKWYFVTSNVADMRDWYTFHQDSSWTGVASWRVRAVRLAYGSAINDLKGATYGPWSPIYTKTTATPGPAAGPIALDGTVSDITATVTNPKAHGLMPGFYWNGNLSITGQPVELYRAYVFSDRDCLNPVYTGAIVGSPAWVPRMSGTLALPMTVKDVATARTKVLVDGGAEPFAFSADQESVVATEGVAASSASAASSGSSTSSGTGTTIISPSTLKNPFERGVVLDLWDRAWPSSAYYWTVLPVQPTLTAEKSGSLGEPALAGVDKVKITGVALSSGDAISIGSGSGSEGEFVVVSVDGETVTLNQALALGHRNGDVVTVGSKLEYDEIELAQDACASGRVGMFGKVSQPVAAGGKTPYVTGLAANRRLLTASATRSPKVYGSLLAAWRPALAADSYELQWGKKAYPFKPVGQVFTASTSAMLSLNAGAWYYRVRGINFQLPTNARGMAWSKVQKVIVARPVFTVAGSRRSAS
jgi:hypothetical protein